MIYADPQTRWAAVPMPVPVLLSAVRYIYTYNPQPAVRPTWVIIAVVQARKQCAAPPLAAELTGGLVLLPVGSWSSHR